MEGEAVARCTGGPDLRCAA
ncbi:hypothetical protein MJ524_20695 [Escherichia coli]|nr:hypothetical protein MJ524_20695 [Escherichia coli]